MDLQTIKEMPETNEQEITEKLLKLFDYSRIVERDSAEYIDAMKEFVRVGRKWKREVK